MRRFAIAILAILMISLVVYIFARNSNARVRIKKKRGTEITARSSTKGEYAAIDEELNEAGQEGKMAGETDAISGFTDDDAGGLQQQLADTVAAQNELENKD